jgi:hypothetical protein
MTKSPNFFDATKGPFIYYVSTCKGVHKSWKCAYVIYEWPLSNFKKKKLVAFSEYKNFTLAWIEKGCEMRDICSMHKSSKKSIKYLSSREANYTPLLDHMHTWFFLSSNGRYKIIRLTWKLVL